MDVYKQFELADQRYLNDAKNQGKKGNTSYTKNPGATGPVSMKGYKPYTQKDFNQLVNNQNMRLGGLGANIGSNDWERAKKKKE